MWFCLVAVGLCLLLCLPSGGGGCDLCKLPNGRDWWWERLGLALVAGPWSVKVLIQLPADGCSQGIVLPPW